MSYFLCSIAPRHVMCRHFYSGRALSPQREQLCPSNPTSCLTLNFLMLLVKGMDREKRGDRGERGRGKKERGRRRRRWESEDQGDRGAEEDKKEEGTSIVRDEEEEKTDKEEEMVRHKIFCMIYTYFKCKQRNWKGQYHEHLCVHLLQENREPRHHSLVPCMGYQLLYSVQCTSPFLQIIKL